MNPKCSMQIQFLVMKNLRLLFATFVFVGCLFPYLTTSVLAAKSPKKVLVVTVTIGFPHSSIPTAEKTLTELGEESGAFTVVDIVRSGPRPADKEQEAAWMEKLTRELAEKMSS